MNRFFEKLLAIDAEWNGLPRRILWILLLFGCLFIALAAFPYVAPFVLAAAFAWMIEPAVRAFSRLLGGGKAARNIASGVFIVLLSGLIITLLLLVLGRVFDEIRTLAVALPGWVSTASADVLAWIESIDLDWPILQDGVEQALLRLLSDAASMLTTLASRVASEVARGAWRAVGFLPQGILFVVLTLMGTFYMSADKERVFSYVKSLLPEKYRKRSSLFRASILRAIFGQMRAALIMLVVTFMELSIGFFLMGLDYAVLFALIIAVLDALPVIGAGLFLLPMCVYGIAFGNIPFAVGAGLIYVCIIVVRQLLEPRIIGRQLGLYPLATMMAMYAGLHAMGFLGMLLGPLMLLLCKVALTADVDLAAEAAGAKPLIPKKIKKQKQSR